MNPPDANTAGRRRIAWILWGAFLLTLANLLFLILKVIKPQDPPGGPPAELMVGLACVTGALALALRISRTRIEPGCDGVIFTRMIIGLALGETVALFGFILHLTGSAPKFTLPMLGSAAFLHFVQAPIDIGRRSVPEGQPDLENGIPRTTIQ